ncbi:hypothetical protein ACFP2V_26685, partial [Streptomyces incanus]
MGRGAPSPSAPPNGSATVPPQPTHGPTRTGQQQPAEQRPTAGGTDARGTGARPETPSETTTRLRPLSVQASAPARPTRR